MVFQCRYRRCSIVGNQVGIVFQHGDEISSLPMHCDVALLNDQDIPWVDLFGSQRRVELPQVLQKLRPRDREDMPIQPRQVIGKPKPGSSWYYTARGEETGRVQVDPMHRCRIFTPTLEKIKMLAGVHG